MKKLFILSLFIVAAMATKAQIKSDSSLLKKSAITPVVKKTVIQQQTTPALAPPKTISKTATGMLAKEKDLAISDMQVQKDISTGKYTISCKIFNVGTSSIDMNLIKYHCSCYGNSNITIMTDLLVHCKSELENCSLTAGYGFNANMALAVYKSNGTAFNPPWGSQDDKILKPGEFFIAKSLLPTVLEYWGKPTPCPSQRFKVTLALDPINRIGDQDLSNNTLSMYFPVQN